MSDPRLLIVDAGHSRLKFFSYSIKGRAFHYQNLQPFEWPSAPAYRSFAECLVTGTNLRMIERVCSHLRSLNCADPKIPGRDFRIPIDSDCSDRTGNDRLALALRAKQLYPKHPCLCISAGSALTVDAVDQDSVFRGGSICPGWQQTRDCLYGMSTRLRCDTSVPGRYPGKNTDEAIASGWLESALGLVKTASEQFKTEHVLLTGGDAELLLPHLAEARHDPFACPDALATALGYPIPEDA